MSRDVIPAQAGNSVEARTARGVVDAGASSEHARARALELSRRKFGTSGPAVVFPLGIPFVTQACTHARTHACTHARTMTSVIHTGSHTRVPESSTPELPVFDA